jgi:effector-binding domain-containing protein/uncharacterized protein YndB with AHSA1/START domain
VLSHREANMPKCNVVKSIQIDADPQKVFELVSDFDTWTTWSPWLCAEPTAKVTVTDDSNSVGSIYAWEGEVTGAGEIEHNRLEPGQLVDMELRFLKPWKSTASTRFEIQPSGEGTRLNWTMDSSLPWFLFWMRSMMEGFIGMDYDRGLKMIKELIETGEIKSRTEIKDVVSIGPLHMAGIRKSCQLKDIGQSMEAAIKEADEKLPAAGISASGEMISVYHRFRLKDQVFDYTAGYILESPADAQPGISVWSTPQTQALRVDHVGSYDHLGNAWSAANQYARYKKLKQCKRGAFEIYKNNPQQVPEAELLTEIYLPLK